MGWRTTTIPATAATTTEATWPANGDSTEIEGFLSSCRWFKTSIGDGRHAYLLACDLFDHEGEVKNVVTAMVLRFGEQLRVVGESQMSRTNGKRWAWQAAKVTPSATAIGHCASCFTLRRWRHGPVYRPKTGFGSTALRGVCRQPASCGRHP